MKLLPSNMMSKVFCEIFSLLILLTWSSTTGVVPITVFTGKHWRGNKTTLALDAIKGPLCFPSFGELNGPIQSFSRRDNCARVYNQEHCNGLYEELDPTTPGGDLSSLGISNPKSIGLCTNNESTCDGALTEQRNVTVSVSFLGQSESAWEIQMSPKTCYTTPQIIRQISDSTFQSQFTVQANNSVCLQLFSDWSCSSTTFTYLHLLEEQISSPIFRGNDEVFMIKSVAFCGYKCVKADGRRHILPSISKFDKHSVIATLYNEPGFRGESYHITLDASTSSCSKIPEFWRIGVESIQLRTNCATYYAHANCSGEDFQELSSSLRNLINVNISRFQSIGLCSPRVVTEKVPHVPDKEVTSKSQETGSNRSIAESSYHWSFSIVLAVLVAVPFVCVIVYYRYRQKQNDASLESTDPRREENLSKLKNDSNVLYKANENSTKLDPARDSAGVYLGPGRS